MSLFFDRLLKKHATVRSETIGELLEPLKEKIHELVTEPPEEETKTTVPSPGNQVPAVKPAHTSDGSSQA